MVRERARGTEPETSETSRPEHGSRGAVPPPSVGGEREAHLADRLLPRAPGTASRARRHRALVVVAGDGRATESAALALAVSFREFGVESVYLGREDRSERIVAAVENEGAQAIELCLGGVGGIRLIRSLLRVLSATGQRAVSIVVHRM